MHKTHLAVASVVALIAAGCEEKQPAPAPKPAASTGAPARGPQAAPPISPSAAPTGAAAGTGAPAATGAANQGTVSASGLTFALPATWKQVPAGNPMRIAEVQVPDASGDAAKMCVLVFSSAGGDIQANIDRWAGQVKDASGQPAKPEITKRIVAGMPVTIASMTGSYAGMGEPAPHANWTLRGAIVEIPGANPLFIKMTGPAEQMTGSAAAFDAMVDSLKKT